MGEDADRGSDDKTGFAYTWNRWTGEPVWPIEERPVAESEIPGELLSPTQPFPTKPAAFEMQELTEDMLINFTPELRAEALEIISDYRLGPLFNPPIQVGHPSGLRSFVSCPSGASNIYGPTSADIESGILYVSTQRGCRSENIVPGREMDEPDDIMTTGQTLSDWGCRQPWRFSGAAGASNLQTSLQSDRCDRHEHRGAPVGNPQRGHTRSHQEPSGSRGCGPTQHGQAITPGHDGYVHFVDHRGGSLGRAATACS